MWSRIWLAARIATRCPRTSAYQGAYARAASAPMPTTGNRVASIAASESRRPTSPKSAPWLLAMVATSTPAARNATNAVGGARK